MSPTIGTHAKKRAAAPQRRTRSTAGASGRRSGINLPMHQDVMLPNVLQALAAATSMTAREHSGADATAALRTASELPGKMVADKKAEAHSAQMPASPAKKFVRVSISMFPKQSFVFAKPRILSACFAQKSKAPLARGWHGGKGKLP